MFMLVIDDCKIGKVVDILGKKGGTIKNAVIYSILENLNWV